MSAPWDSALNLWGTAMANNTREAGTVTTKKNLSQEAINKLIYDALSSDQGLANLVSKENLTGGNSASSTTLLAQDMMTKLIGELASITAETEQTKKDEKTTKEGRALNKFADNTGTVICTELARQGKLDRKLYEAAPRPWNQVSYFTWRGYSAWASRVVPLMQKSERLSNALLPVVRSRYLLLTAAPGFHFFGRLTKWIGEPICWILGYIIAHLAHYSELKHGRVQ